MSLEPVAVVYIFKCQLVQPRGLLYQLCCSYETNRLLGFVNAREQAPRRRCGTLLCYVNEQSAGGSCSRVVRA